MPRRLPFLLLLGLLVCAPSAQATSPTGRLVVRLADSGAHSKTHAAALVARAGGRLASGRVPALGLVTVRPARGGSLTELETGLRRVPGVLRIEREHRGAPRALPNDPALGSQEPAAGAPQDTPLQWWASRQNLPAAWDVRQTHRATVAIIDTGVDASHPELAARIVGGDDNDPTPGAGPESVDEEGHGTHVASLACATPNNGIGIAGAAYGCRLLVYKSDFSDASIAESIVEATDAGADAINMSFGTTAGEVAPQAVRDAVEYAHDRGVILVAAAADEPTDGQGYPADLLQPTGTGADPAKGLGLSVTAANFVDRRASFAGFGSQISMAAYGAWNTGSGGPRGLLGAFPAADVALERAVGGARPCNCRTVVGGDRRFAYVQGTSMAAPMVTGVAAMVRRLNPDLSADEVIAVLKQTARREPGSGWAPDLGWGILDAGAAVAAARTLDRRAPATKLRVSKRRGRTLNLRIVGVDRAPSGVQRSGIASYEVYRRIDGGKATRIARTERRRVRLRLSTGRRYTFWSVATDVAGNRERSPKRPDVTLKTR
ncbi:MAG: S8 family serine peptidase [Solirubrobacterales bacterium]|nr:S8 family serine peptidase [Solirubrobacterales bacterium]